MILLNAEAILASSTSKFGIGIPLVDDEDFKSSTESTISTSLIHCKASVGNCDQVHTSSVKFYLPAIKRVEVEIRNLQSLLVCPIFLKESPPLKMTEFFGSQSRLSSLILILFLSFTFLHCGWMERLLDRWTPQIQFLRIKCWWWRTWICKNVSRKTMCVPNAWRPFSAARHSKSMSKHAFRNWMKWEWHWSTGSVKIFPLRLDSAPWNSYESHILFISFCYSCIPPESSKIVSWSSTNLLLAIVSKVELWNFLNSSISVRLFWWAWRNSKFCCNNCSWRSCWSRCWTSSARAQWSSCWDSTISPNFSKLLS